MKDLKRVLVRIGNPSSNFRTTADWSRQRCGQEHPTERFWPISDEVLGMLATKGFMLIRIIGTILKDRCTCRVCLPTKEDLSAFDVKSRCYISGLMDERKSKA